MVAQDDGAEALVRTSNCRQPSHPEPRQQSQRVVARDLAQFGRGEAAAGEPADVVEAAAEREVGAEQDLEGATRWRSAAMAAGFAACAVS